MENTLDSSFERWSRQSSVVGLTRLDEASHGCRVGRWNFHDTKETRPAEPTDPKSQKFCNSWPQINKSLANQGPQSPNFSKSVTLKSHNCCMLDPFQPVISQLIGRLVCGSVDHVKAKWVMSNSSQDFHSHATHVTDQSTGRQTTGRRSSFEMRFFGKSFEISSQDLQSFKIWTADLQDVGNLGVKVGGCEGGKISQVFFVFESLFPTHRPSQRWKRRVHTLDMLVRDPESRELRMSLEQYRVGTIT